MEPQVFEEVFAAFGKLPHTDVPVRAFVIGFGSPSCQPRSRGADPVRSCPRDRPEHAENDGQRRQRPRQRLTPRRPIPRRLTECFKPPPGGNRHEHCRWDDELHGITDQAHDRKHLEEECEDGSEAPKSYEHQDRKRAKRESRAPVPASAPRHRREKRRDEPYIQRNQIR